MSFTVYKICQVLQNKHSAMPFSELHLYMYLVKEF